MADERAATSIVDTAIDAFGRLDIVVNNAGIHGDPANFDALSIEQFRAMLDVHFFGALLRDQGCVAALPDPPDTAGSSTPFPRRCSAGYRG